MMKLSLAPFFVVFLCSVRGMNLSEGDKKLLMDMHQACQAKSGVTEEVVGAALTGDFKDDPALKVHLLCMSQKLGVLNDAGELQMDHINEMVGKFVDDSMKGEVLKCAVQQETPLQTAFEMAQCAFKLKFNMA